MTTLREDLIKKIDDHLSDWDKDASWSRQAARFADSIIETMNEVAPRRFIPDNALCLFLDGNQWCCCRGNFVNLQESLAGFGATRVAAMAELEREETKLRETADVTVKPRFQIEGPENVESDEIGRLKEILRGLLKFAHFAVHDKGIDPGFFQASIEDAATATKHLHGEV
jgi:hypothetical protein